jgi:hypothetical protein
VPETDRAAMKRDAFDDVDCPFNYKLELQKAHEALKAKVGKYVSVNQATGYRELAKQFHMSPAALCAIAKKYSRKRKLGRRSRGTTATFYVRQKIEGKELETVVTVTAHEKISVKSMRESVARYFKTDDVSVRSGMKTERRAKYRYEELLHS